tara:strand:- start:117 stop:323 length:207 start_codon:yes stop_codon:yes gene_type:complete
MQTQLFFVAVSAAGSPDCKGQRKHFDHIEIGTSDFSTISERVLPGWRGLAVDAIPVYIERVKGARRAH